MSGSLIKYLILLLWIQATLLVVKGGQVSYLSRPVRNTKRQCRTDDGLQGTCMKMIECPNLPAQVTTCLNEIRGVCCPDTDAQVAPTTPVPEDDDKCTTEDGTLGRCVGIFECIPRPETLSMCTGSRRGVCCPSAVQAPEDCGIDPLNPRTAITGFIIGGTDADPGAWPWMAALFSKDRGKSVNICGGALIKNQFILTASHCVDRNKSPDSYFVRINGHDLTKSAQQDGNSEEIEVEDVRIHPKYLEGKFNNDIAILKLKRPAKEDSTKICLPGKQTSSGDRTFLTGWGLTNGGGSSEDFTSKTSAILQQISFTVVSTDRCAQKYREKLPEETKTAFPEGIQDTAFLCATVGGIVTTEQRSGDACQGDSGGPLMTQRGDGRWEVVGVVSVGNKYCGRDLPTLYTRVSSYLTWIKQATRS